MIRQSRSYQTEGIILKRQRFGEADLLLTIFSKHKGKIKLLAKGVRKTTSRKGGHLELFNLVRLLVAKGRNLDIITEAEEVESFASWKKDLEKVARAYGYCEVVDKLLPEAVPNQKIFFLLKKSFETFSQEASEEAFWQFELKLLEELGFWPRGEKFQKLSPEDYIERIIEKKLKSRRFLQEVKELGSS